MVVFSFNCDNLLNYPFCARKTSGLELFCWNHLMGMARISTKLGVGCGLGVSSHLCGCGLDPIIM